MTLRRMMVFIFCIALVPYMCCLADSVHSEDWDGMSWQRFAVACVTTGQCQQRLSNLGFTGDELKTRQHSAQALATKEKVNCGTGREPCFLPGSNTPLLLEADAEDVTFT